MRWTRIGLMPQPSNASHKAVQQLPQLFRDYLPAVVFRVEEFADAEALQSVGLSKRLVADIRFAVP